MGKKLLSWILSLAMVLSLCTAMPLTANAEVLPVCEIGSVQYTDLGTALLSAPVDEKTTIILLRDISYTNSIIADERTITIDLNGQNLNVSGVDGHALQAVNNGALNIFDVGEDGGSFNVTSSGEFRSCAYASSGGDINITGTLTALFPGGMGYQEIIAANAYGTGSTITLNGNASGYYAGAVAQNGASVTVVGNVEGFYYGALAAYGGRVDITGNISATTNGLTLEYGGRGDVVGDIAGSYGLFLRNVEPFDTLVGNITGNIIINDASGRGILADGEADITLNGNIVANGGYGVDLTGGAEVTINGSISGASTYIQVGGTTYAEGTGGVEGAYMKYSYPNSPDPENIVFIRIAEPDDIVTDLVIEDAIAPINGESPLTAIAETDEYSGTIAWTGNPPTFSPNNSYTATITLIAKEGYTFEGIAANAFTVPCAMSSTNEAVSEDDSGNITITATFIAPPEGYTTDGYGVMSYRYINNSRLDIKGFHGGAWLRTTFSDGGYRFYYILGEITDLSQAVTLQGPLNLYNQPVAIPDSDLTVHLIPSFANGGKAVKLTYQITNDGENAEIISMAGGSDVQIGSNDGAPMSRLDDGRGFMMFNGTDQFNFFGVNTVGVTNVDSFWFGSLGYLSANYFIQQTATNITDVDSAMSFSWQNKTVAPGQTRNFSVVIGIGGAGSEVPTELGVIFDSQGGSDVSSITGLNSGDTASAPTPPTRSGYTFGGWHTEAECINAFDFSTPITATRTLYAKWSQEEPSSSGGSAPTRYPSAPSQYPVEDANPATPSGGNTTLSKDRAEAGDTVVITVTPGIGYVSDTPLVLDDKSNPLEVTDNGDGTFSFIMPSNGVKVDVDYSRIDYFDDVSGEDWFDEASWFCAAHGLIQGTGNKQFDGHMDTNRAMLVTVLHRLANGSDHFESIFDDVEIGKWYSETIGWAAHNNIVVGYGNRKFGPEDALTREQMVSFLYRYTLFMNYSAGNQGNLDTFIDADAVSDWALEAMQWAVGNGIVEGTGDGLLSPKTSATRAQFAAMIQRYITTFIN